MAHDPHYSRRQPKPPPPRRDLNAAEQQLLADIFGSMPGVIGKSYYRTKGHLHRSVTIPTLEDLDSATAERGEDHAG